MALALPFRRKEPTIDDHAEQVDNNLRLAMRNADELESAEPAPELKPEARRVWDALLAGDYCERREAALRISLHNDETALATLKAKREETNLAIMDLEIAILGSRKCLEVYTSKRIDTAVEGVRQAAAEDARQQAAE